MGIGVSLILLAIGAILVWATTWTTIGWIVLAVGVFGIVMSLVFWSTWGGFGGTRRETIVEERHYR
jgi:hypothetical protein